MGKTALKILTIGNSFTDSLSAYFSEVVESAGCELHFERANHGGCELHRHWSYIENEERDRVYSMYQDRRFKMREILARTEWDVVTIQQASHFSWQPQTYQPFATNIHDYIGQHAPGAEIVIQQTWAYRDDDPRIRPGGAWQYNEAQVQTMAEYGIELPADVMTVTQADMVDGLTEAYKTLAQDMGGLRIIPSGLAVQLTRTHAPVPFQNYDPSLMETLVWPDLPPQAGDVVGKIWWRKNGDGELELARDCIHLNARGQYLQACVWFAFLYERRTDAITFVPDVISNSDAAFLRDMAQQAVDPFSNIGA